MDRGRGRLSQPNKPTSIALHGNEADGKAVEGSRIANFITICKHEFASGANFERVSSLNLLFLIFNLHFYTASLNCESGLNTTIPDEPIPLHGTTAYMVREGGPGRKESIKRRMTEIEGPVTLPFSSVIIMFRQTRPTLTCSFDPVKAFIQSLIQLIVSGLIKI